MFQIVKRTLVGTALAGSLALGATVGSAVVAPVVASAAYYDSRYKCYPVGSFGKWYANGFDSRGNHDYTGPRRTLKASATSDCVDWLSVTR